jgi:hypothetical protein
LAVRPGVIIRKRSGIEEGWAFVAIQGSVLTVQEAAVIFFTHSSRAEGAIGFACRHFGEEAFGKRRRIKIPSFQDKNAKQKECNIIHQKKVARRIHMDAARRSMTGKCGTMTGEYSVKRDGERQGNMREE